MKLKSFNYLVFLIAILFVASLACQAASDIFEEDPQYYDESYDSQDGSESDYEGDAVESVPEADNSPADNGVPASEVFCPAVTGNILSVATQIVEGSAGDSDEEPENQYLVTYEISGDNISNPFYENVSSDLESYQNDAAVHQEIWDYFVILIPASERAGLEEFMIVTDGESNGLAAVGQTTYDPKLWSLEVDIVDSNDKLNLTYTLIHEYAHLLTLGPDQVTPSLAVFNNPDDEGIIFEEASACPVYFPGEGCSQADSYINAFFNQFWADIHEEWQNINLIEDTDEYYDALDNFYYEYEDRFVTDYAATNPEEDIAEAFTFFVLSPRPAGNTVAEEKILFFYDYPELVQLRDEILNGVCQLN